MNQYCTHCGHRYDDVNRTTICPHSSVDHANTLCVVHDLHDCTMQVNAGAGARHDTTACRDLAQRVYQLIEPIYPSENGLTPSHDARAWMHRAQPLMNMQIPRELIARGEIDRVLQCVHQLRDGVHA